MASHPHRISLRVAEPHLARRMFCRRFRYTAAPIHASAAAAAITPTAISVLFPLPPSPLSPASTISAVSIAPVRISSFGKADDDSGARSGRGLPGNGAGEGREEAKGEGDGAREMRAGSKGAGADDDEAREDTEFPGNGAAEKGEEAIGKGEGGREICEDEGSAVERRKSSSRGGSNAVTAMVSHRALPLTRCQG
ncbi:unnamed protein product [Musa hybrid cultivar]